MKTLTRTLMAVTFIAPQLLTAAITIEEFSVATPVDVLTQVAVGGTPGSFLNVQQNDGTTIGGELSASVSGGTATYSSNGTTGTFSVNGGLAFAHWDGVDGDAANVSRQTSMNLQVCEENLDASVIRIYGNIPDGNPPGTAFMYVRMVFFAISGPIAETGVRDSQQFPEDLGGYMKLKDEDTTNASELLAEFPFSKLKVPIVGTDFTNFAALADVRGIELQMGTGTIEIDRIEIVNEMCDGGGGGNDWGGNPVDGDGNVDTGSWLGWLNVDSAPYAWSYGLDGWVYVDESTLSPTGGWIYRLK